MFSYFSKNKEESKVAENKDDDTESKIMISAITKLDDLPNEIQKPAEQIRYENLTEDETKLCEYISTEYKQQISKYKCWTKDIIPRFVTDTYYIKKYDERLKLTTSRFEQYLQHRDQYNFDEMLSSPELNTDKDLKIYQENTEIFALYYYGIDHMGHPCLWDNGTEFGHGDKIQKLFVVNDNNSFERASKWRLRAKKMESNLFLRLSKQYQCEISQSVVIMDLSKASVSDFYTNRAFYQWNLRSASELFPETVYKIFIVNAPWAFQMIWKMCVAFLDDITVEKTKILGSDYLKELVKYIDIEMIPKEFGGKGVFGEPRPGNVPKDFPLQMHDLSDDEEEEKDDKDKNDGDKDKDEDTEDKIEINANVDENVIAYQQAVYGNDLTEKDPSDK